MKLATLAEFGGASLNFSLVMCGDASWPDHRCGFHRIHLKLRISVCKDESEKDPSNTVGLLPQDKILQAGLHMKPFLSTSFFISVYVFIYICRYKHRYRYMYTHIYILKILSLQEISTRNNFRKNENCLSLLKKFKHPLFLRVPSSASQISNSD